MYSKYICGMENMEELYRLYLSSKGICTDSRKLEVGQLFFALREKTSMVTILPKLLLKMVPLL